MTSKTNHFKRWCMSASMLMLVSLMSAQEIPRWAYSLVAWAKNGEQVAFPFEDEPKITIEGTHFVVTSSQLTMEYAANDIERFTLSRTELPPEQPEEPEEPVQPETNYHLIVWTMDGNYRAFAFSDEPRVTIEGDWFVVSSTKVTMRYPAIDIVKFTLLDGDEATGVEAVRSESLVETTMQQGRLSVRGLAAQGVVRVVTANGSIVRQVRADAEGSVSLSIDDLPRGVYVIQTPTRSFKIRK